MARVKGGRAEWISVIRVDTHEFSGYEMMLEIEAR